MKTLGDIFTHKDRRRIERKFKRLFGYRELYNLPFFTFTDQYIGGAFIKDLVPALLMNLTPSELAKLIALLEEVRDEIYEKLEEAAV